MRATEDRVVEDARLRQDTITARLTADMRASLDAELDYGYDERIHASLLDALVGDAMHQVDLLLKEIY